MCDAIVEHPMVDVLRAAALALTFKNARLVIIPAHHNKLIKDSCFARIANAARRTPKGIEQLSYVMGFSLDHSVRSRQHIRRDRHSKLLRGFQVNHQLKLSRLLDGQIGWLGAF
jgi:hypothetical protein